MEKLIYASMPDPDSASRAVAALMDRGVQSEDISVFAKAFPGNPDAADDVRVTAEEGFTVTTPADTLEGAKRGGAIGLGVGVLAALAATAVPGLGIVLGGGALAMALASVAATGVAGAVAGGVAGSLIDQGVDDDAARSYATVVENGGALIAVDAPSGDVTETEVTEILLKYGAVPNGILALMPRDGTYPSSESHTAVYQKISG
ncbi:MAG: hypothetical protein JST30_02015 [Armatimonadetes bacterium]|nr:hypothetical protein [Armatimonadota bacterium]